MYALMIIFTCHGVCGDPDSVVIGQYDTLSACKAQGQVWVSHAANPDRAVEKYKCLSGKELAEEKHRGK
jgi:hypothetical protein